ncbi:MAG: hypothetical protein RMJ86_10235 [Anaerolineae bacterium]|nr:hypothetical protein [Anaerolineae bacterium]
MRNRKFIFALIVLSLGLVLAALPQIGYPLWFDQGALAACGDVLNHGGVFLRDCWDVRGPITPLLYAGALRLLREPVSIFALNLAWQALTAAAIAWQAWRWWGHRLSALLAATIYWLAMASLNYWSVAQAEGFANLFFVAATAAAWRVRRRADWRWALLGGLLSGVLFWVKYPFGVYALALLALLLIQRTARAVLLFWIAGGAVAAVAGAAYFALNGALGELWLHVQYAIANFHNKPLDERWAWLTGVFWVEITTFARVGSTPTAGFKDTVQQVEWLGRGYPFWMLLMALGMVRALWLSEKRRALAWALLWLAIGVMLNIWQGHSYRYHFIIWLPPMALLAAAALAKPASDPLRLWVRLPAIVLMALFVAGQIAALWPWVRDAFDNLVLQRKPLRALYLESKEAPTVLLADFLAQNTAPEARVAIFSDTPAVHVLAQRLPATRFPYVRWADEARDPALREALAQRYLADLQRAAPRFFILTRDEYPWPSARFIETWKRLPELHRFVEANYRYVGEVGPYLVFERKP